MAQSQEKRIARLPDEIVQLSQDTPRPTAPFRTGLAMAIVSGLLLWLAHPTPGLWPLAWIGLTPLILALQTASDPRRAALLGYLFAWAYLAPTWYWTGLTIVGWTGSPIGWAALLLLTLLAAIFYATWAVAAWWMMRRAHGAWRMVGLASAWVVMEWLRSVGSLSFPWAQVCYSQYRALPVVQISELTGALGVSFLIVLVNAGIVESWRRRAELRSTRWALCATAIVGLVCLAGCIRMRQLPSGKPVKIGIMQGNFDYKSGFNIMRQKLTTFDVLTRAAYESASPHPDLYVWAETAAPGDAFNDPLSRGAIQRLADTYHAAILTGSRIVEGDVETNSALLFTPGGTRPQRFDKQGIVPFGEYIPFRSQIPSSIQKQFQFFESDITPGRSLTPMNFDSPIVGPVSIGPFICYESVYPHYTRTMTRLGASLLVTPSHDQWFQSEAAMEQHLAIVVFRAVENRRDVARSTTDGISAAIDGRGDILARAPLYKTTFLVQTLHLRSLITIYTHFGDWFVGLCALLMCIAYYNVDVSNWLASYRSSRPGRSGSQGTMRAAGG